MGIKVTGSINIKRSLQKKLKAGKKAASKELQAHIKVIQKNVKRGRAFDGAPYRGTRSGRGYEKNYRKKRKNAGFPTSPVNLSLTGSMLKGMRIKITPKGNSIQWEIFFNKARKKPPKGFGKAIANDKKAAGNQKQRGFFGMSPKQRKRLVDKIKKGMANE